MPTTKTGAKKVLVPDGWKSGCHFGLKSLYIDASILKLLWSDSSNEALMNQVLSSVLVLTVCIISLTSIIMPGSINSIFYYHSGLLLTDARL